MLVKRFGLFCIYKRYSIFIYIKNEPISSSIKQSRNIIKNLQAEIPPIHVSREVTFICLLVLMRVSPSPPGKCSQPQWKLMISWGWLQTEMHMHSSCFSATFNMILEMKIVMFFPTYLTGNMAGNIGSKRKRGKERRSEEGKKEGKKNIFFSRTKPAREQSIQLNIF